MYKNKQTEDTMIPWVKQAQMETYHSLKFKGLWNAFGCDLVLHK